MFENKFPDYSVPGVQHQDFHPYEYNGGTIVAIAGDDFALIAADTRLSSNYNIHTRHQSKLFKLSNRTVLASTGCWADVLGLTSVVAARRVQYEHDHHQEMTTNAVAQMLSIMMYNKRFFPYYLANVLAGLDSEGKGVIYSYDPIGHCEASKYHAGGTAGALLLPLLDHQVAGNHTEHGSEPPKIAKEKAMLMVVDCFVSASERDIYTGDSIIMNIITKDGIETKTFELRKD